VSSLLKLDQNITLVQEVWNPSSDILKILQDKNYFIKRRPDGYGGSAIFINDDRLKPLSDPIQINDDSHIVKISIGGDRNMWISSLYINRKSKKSLLDTVSKIQSIVPPTEWQYLLLGGDWNINIQDKQDKVTQTLNIVCKIWGSQSQAVDV